MSASKGGERHSTVIIKDRATSPMALGYSGGERREDKLNSIKRGFNLRRGVSGHLRRRGKPRQELVFFRLGGFKPSGIQIDTSRERSGFCFPGGAAHCRPTNCCIIRQ